MTDHEIAQRGIDATKVLENPAFREAMNLLKADVVERWKSCKVRDKEGQQLLLQLAKLADDFEFVLSGLVESGKLSQRRIDFDKLRAEHPLRKAIRRVL